MTDDVTTGRTTGRYTGRPIQRVNDAGLLRGDVRFVDDLPIAGLHHAVIVRSTVAHARLLHIDTDAARARPGVVAVLGPEEIAAATHPMHCTWVLPGQAHTTYPVVDATVRYVGQPIAIVVATRLALALDAAELVAIDYEELPVVLDPEDALLEGSPRLYADLGSNRSIDVRVGSTAAECEGVISGAAHVVSGRFRVQRQMASPMETRGIVAAPEPAGGSLTVWASTQCPHHVREDLARTLGLPLHALRVIAPGVGGGFGPKDHLYPDEVMVCVAARRIGKPVKWIEQRSEHAHATVHARDQVQLARLAFDDDGRFLAIDARVVVDLGAQTTNVGGGPAFSTAALLEGPYRFDAAGTTVVGALTNKTPSGAYRGFGQGEAAWMRERLVDEAARVLGLCPVEIRRRNMIGVDQMPFLTHGGQSYDSGNYAEALDRANAILAEDKRSVDCHSPNVRRGTGVASYVQFAGSATAVERNINFRIAGYETVVLRMEPDGTVLLHTGVSPHGQGLETTLAQVTADRLGVPMSTVHVVVGDTASTPSSAGTIASRSMMLAGGAAIGAAAALQTKLLAIAAHRFEVAPEDLVLHDGVVSVVGSPTITVAVAELADAAWLGWDLPPGVEPGLEVRHTFDPEDCSYSYATHAVEVLVDMETGAVSIERYVVVQDCGVIVNPMIVEGQIHGAVAQGIGGALLEAVCFDENGQPLTSTFADYAIPSACEVPNIRIEHLEHPTPRIPGGMKGMGEGGIVPTAPAIANAIAAAVPEIAAHLTATPLDPEQLWRLIEAVRTGGPIPPAISHHRNPR